MAAFLATLYFLMAFNAYACLIPLYGAAPMEQGGDCATPKEPPLRDACDTFKSIGVQNLSSAQPLSTVLLHESTGDLPAATRLAPTLLRHHEFSSSPPFLSRDPLSLISILRI